MLLQVQMQVVQVQVHRKPIKNEIKFYIFPSKKQPCNTMSTPANDDREVYDEIVKLTRSHNDSAWKDVINQIKHDFERGSSLQRIDYYCNRIKQPYQYKAEEIQSKYIKLRKQARAIIQKRRKTRIVKRRTASSASSAINPPNLSVPAIERITTSQKRANDFEERRAKILLQMKIEEHTMQGYQMKYDLAKQNYETFQHKLNAIDVEN